jgi:hypothetical protein
LIAVIEDHVELRAVGPLQCLLDAPVEFLGVHALPGEDGDAGLRDGGGGVVLGGKDVARAPAHFRAELDQRLDEDGGLDRHVQAAGDLRSRKRLLALVLGAQRHEARHFRLGDGDFLAAEFGLRDVFYFVVGAHGSVLSVVINLSKCPAAWRRILPA